MLAMAIAPVILLLAFIATSVNAAEFHSLKSGGPCSLRMNGPVEEGDFDTLRNIVNGGQLRAPIVLCLNSPGGSYTEGLRIIEYLLDSEASVGTMVERQAACESICALIFLSGHKKVDAKTKVPDRQLHVSARLGFHGPYINTTFAIYDPTIAAKAYEAGLRAVGRLLERPEENLFPLSLLGAGLAKGPDEFLYVDKVGLAGGWQVNLVGYRKPRWFSIASLEQACSNVDDWHVFNSSPLETARMQDPKLDKSPIPFQNGRFRKMLDGYGGEGTFKCFVDAIDAGSKGVFFNVQIGDPNLPAIRDAHRILMAEIASGPKDPRGPGIPLFYTYHPDTLVKSIEE